MSGGKSGGGGGGGQVDHGNIMEMVRDIQVKMKQQDEESLELKEQVMRLEQHNEQLREDSCVWQRECERLRSEIASLQQTPGGSGGGTTRAESGWKEEAQRLRTQISDLQRENARLRSELSKTSQTGCCCFQLCQVLFGGNKTRNTADTTAQTSSQQTRNATSSNNHYYNNPAVRIQ